MQKVFIASFFLALLGGTWVLGRPSTSPPPHEWNSHGAFCLTESPSPSLVRLAQSAPIKKNSYRDKVTTNMALIPEGEFWMGDSEALFSDALPLIKVKMKKFWMDKHLVTNKEFATFVAETQYVTLAERPLNPEEYPDARHEELLPSSIVFTPPSHSVNLNDHQSWWKLVPGANWKHPLGPKSSIEGKDNDPVVHIAYEDAKAYADWIGKRLPTEAEWEYAARGGIDRKPYTWGDEIRPHGKYMANTWQGEFPTHNSAQDGFIGVSPVGSFPANGYGLYDMSGNVWQWVSDWYQADYYRKLATLKQIENPQGPSASFDPQEPGVTKRIHKGGSFLCTDQYCARFRPGSRGKGDVMSGTNHLGFRLVLDL